MKELHKTHEVFDCDMKSLTQSEVDHIAFLVTCGITAVFKNQTFTMEEELETAGKFGNLERRFDGAYNEEYSGLFLEGSDLKINRVTGAKDKNGRPGLFGHKETLSWHCNNVGAVNRKELLWVHGVSGVEGSRTSFLNTAMSYYDLDPKLKVLLKQSSFRSRLINWETYIEDSNINLKTTNDKWKGIKEYISCYIVNKSGMPGIFFPFMGTVDITGLPEGITGHQFCKVISKHITKKKYVYHHDWEIGDVVLSDQNLTQHKRWAFDKIDDRLLHRIVSDYSQCNIKSILT